MTIPLSTLAKYTGPLFIETGTHEGYCVQKALDCGFREIHSIEAARVRHNVALGKFRNHPQVHLYLGTSQVWLPKILLAVNRVATLWLDAHQGRRCALFAELESIKANLVRGHTILIDDVRLFSKWSFTVADVEAKLLEIDPQYTFVREQGHVEGDILAATPPGECS